MMCGMLLKVSCCGLTFRIDRHVGLRKKLEKLAIQKGCELVGEWQKSIINHLSLQQKMVMKMLLGQSGYH